MTSINQYIIVRPNVDQRAGQLSLPQVNLQKGNTKFRKMKCIMYNMYIRM